MDDAFEHLQKAQEALSNCCVELHERGYYTLSANIGLLRARTEQSTLKLADIFEQIRDTK